jgi:hypothetical protein
MLKKRGRLVSINGTDVTITDMDYNYPNDTDNVKQKKFNITFTVNVNNQVFVINFSNERLSEQTQYISDTFIGTGDTYHDFLKAAENNDQLRDKKQFSDDTKNAADEVIGAIAQSVYIHVQSHSPDQDEE